MHILGKGKEVDLYTPIVSISTTKRSDVDHTELPANTPHLPFYTSIENVLFVFIVLYLFMCIFLCFCLFFV